MSYSFRLPEEEPICECKYDEGHDRMDRDDCPFHCEMFENSEPESIARTERRPIASRSPCEELAIEVAVDAREPRRL
jgi:hypothetical protein